MAFGICRILSHLCSMTLTDFKNTLHNAAPPAAITPYLESLWWDGKGNWQRAHDVIENQEDATAAWVHAYLHRKEGDKGNARYWYARAGRPVPEVTLEQEWESIVTALSGH